jgi:hypothetical protein
MGARRTTGLTLAAVLAAGLALGCGEDLLAPATGTCPGFCPPEQLEVVDSVLIDIITSDSTFTGYVLPREATALQTYRDSSDAGEAGSRALMTFPAFSDSLRIGGASDTTRGPVVGTDSIAVRLQVSGGNVDATGRELLLYRISPDVDTAATYGDLDPLFADSSLLATVPVADSVTGDSLHVTLDGSAFPGFEQDGNRVAIGVALRNPTGYVQLGSVEGGTSAIVTRYVRVDSAGTAVPRVEGRTPDFDTFVGTAFAPAPGTARVIGGVPAARTLLRFALPGGIADSSEVLRATLLLVPSEPVLGAPNDSLAVIAQGLATDVGAKSPLAGVPADSVALRVAFVGVGSTDTVRLDVTDLVIRWTNDSTAPSALALRAIPEGSSFAELRIGAADGALRPRLQVTYVPPLRLGER